MNGAIQVPGQKLSLAPSLAPSPFHVVVEVEVEVAFAVVVVVQVHLSPFPRSLPRSLPFSFLSFADPRQARQTSSSDAVEPTFSSSALGRTQLCTWLLLSCDPHQPCRLPIADSPGGGGGRGYSSRTCVLRHLLALSLGGRNV